MCCYRTKRDMVRDGDMGRVCACGSFVAAHNKDRRHLDDTTVRVLTCSEYEAKVERNHDERGNQTRRICEALGLTFDDTPTWEVVTQRIVDKIRDLRGRNKSDPREQSQGLRARGGRYTEPGNPIIYVDNGWGDE
jgi:hypothetical protein